MIIKLPLKGQFYYRYIHTFIRYEKEVGTKKVKKGRKMNQQDQNDKKNEQTPDAAVFVRGLEKSFRGKAVLKGVNFTVLKGTVFALLGSNGAGKTTTVRILTTQVQADSGIVQIEGYDVQKNPHKVHETMSVTGQFSAVDHLLTGRENLVIMGRLHHLLEPEKKAVELLAYFELSEAADRAVSTYSGGMKRKLDLAMSLVGNPRVLFLDEPTTGLDPQSRRSMWQMIRELNENGMTIVLTTQYLEEAEQLADLVAILDKGTIIAQGTPENLKAYLPQGVVQFTFPDGNCFALAKSLLKDYRVSEETETYKLSVFTDGRADTLAEIFARLYQNKVRITDFSKHTPDLEDAFLAMIEEREEMTDASCN